MNRVVVGGAFANEKEVLLGNYQGVPEHIITLYEGIQMYNEKAILINVYINENIDNRRKN